MALRVLAGVAVLCASVAAFRQSVFSTGQGGTPVHLKDVTEFKLPRRELAFARSASSYLRNRNVLAPEDVVCVLGLIDPSIRFETTRSEYTRHLFDNIGLREEGRRRVAAQQLLTTGLRTAENETALLHSLQTDVNAIIAGDFGEDFHAMLAELMKKAPDAWDSVFVGNGYVLFLRS